VAEKTPTYVVTGAAGFIGARFVESCFDRGIRVVSVDKFAHFNDRSEHAGVPFGTPGATNVLRIAWIEG